MSLLSKTKVHEEFTFLQDTQLIGSLLGWTIHIIYAVLFGVFNCDFLFWFNIFFSLPVFTACIILSYKGQLRIAPVIATIEVATHQVIAVLFLGQETAFHILLFCLIPLGILFYKWKRSFFINSMLAFVLFLLISWFDTGQLIRYHLSSDILKIIRLINSTGLFGIVGLIFYYYLSLNKRLYARQKETSIQLSESHQKLNEQHRNITESIEYAERIQEAVLPPEEYLAEALKDYFILFKPRDIVSGDFYWATRRDQKLLVAVADCTGHGVPGALLSMLGISFLNEIVNQETQLSANQILNLLRDYLIKSLHQTGKKGESQDGIEIALAIIDTHENKLEYAGAKRPLYVVRKVSKPVDNEDALSQSEVIQYKPNYMPIGIYDQEDVPFTNQIIRLRKDDAVYMFSDGYVDQMGGPQRKTFKTHRFRKILTEIQEFPMQKQKEILNESLTEWQANVEQIDDILVLGFSV